MEKNLYIDASHPNETRVVLKSDDKIEDYEYEGLKNNLIKNNIYLGKVSRIEPSLQAAFIDFGRDRHGFLSFNDIQSDYYQIPKSDLELIKLEEEKAREELKQKLKAGTTFNDFSFFIKSHWLLKRYLLDVAILTALCNDRLLYEEKEFLDRFCDEFEIPKEELEENINTAENFLIMSQNNVEFLKANSSYKKVYSSLTKRWRKIILRNREKLSEELSESKELISLVKKSMHQELTNEEKDLVKSQFKDVLKSVPSLAIFMFPGGVILLPLVLKIIPDLLPSAFKENQIDS